MNVPLYIAWRYLFSKKSHHVVNIISMISVCSIAIATAALVCVLSVFNGFTGLVASMFSAFDPELKIVPVTGKVFDPRATELLPLYELSEIAQVAEVLEENVLVRYNDRQEIAVAMGVSDGFRQMASIDTLLLDGEFILQEEETSYAVVSVGLSYALGVNASFVEPLSIYAPKREGKINMNVPSSSFLQEYAFVGGVFCVNQAIYDERHLLVPIALMRQLLQYEREVSSLMLKVSPGADVSKVKRTLRTLLGDGYRVEDRFEQQEASFKMMQIEKWITFLILFFILVIASFNVVSSLFMLMIEKRDDVRVLRSMGADKGLLHRIFFLEGCLITFFGTMIGLFLGFTIAMLQQQFGIVKMSNQVGLFVSDNYPVVVVWHDLLIVFFAVMLIGVLVAWYPVHTFSKRWIKQGRVAVWLLLLFSVGCQPLPQSDDRVVVTLLPQCYFVEKVAGERFSTYCMVPPGQSPETYEPAPHEMMQVAQSRAYLRIGRIGFELAWMDRIEANYPDLEVFDLSEGVSWLGDACHHHHHGHDHDHDHHHDHADGDPHIWSGISTSKIIAKNTLAAFQTMDPDHADEYQENYLALLQEMDQLEEELHAMLDTLSIRSFVIYHPALTYFADDFGLTQYSLESDGKEPSVASLKQLVDQATGSYVRVVFVQEEFDRKHAEQVAKAIGARVVTINPLDQQWDRQLRFIAHELIKE